MKQTLKVKGMTCKACEALIKDALEDIGVDAKADHKKGTVEVQYDNNTTNTNRIQDAIEEEGYEAEK